MDTISTLNALKAVQAALTEAAPSATQEVMLYNPDGTPAGKYPAHKLCRDMAKHGNGFGTCDTAAATAAKTVSITDFVLIKNGVVNILFSKAVSVAGATLNVSSTGAKAIRYNGNTIQPGVIKANCTVGMQYDGTYWNIISIVGLEQGNDDDSLFVDLGLPSGLKWAKKNIDATQANGFAANEFQYECSFFSWGNTEPHNPTSNSSFAPYDWGTANDGVYADTPGAQLTGNEPASQDAARAILGAPWRQPTTAEFQELIDNCDFINADGTAIDTTQANKLVTVNSIVGIYLKSKINGKRIFFPCSGYGGGSSWYNRGSSGNYWSGSLYSAAYGRGLSFYSGGVYPQDGSNRFNGFAVRAVQ